MTRLSYVHGTSGTPLIGETIGVYFDQAVERFGERDALIVRHQQIRWSWHQLKQRVDALATGLMALGLESGARIGVWSPNNAEWVVTQFATAKAGLILVNINPAYRLAELEYALNKAGCTALITATRYPKSSYLRRPIDASRTMRSVCHKKIDITDGWGGIRTHGGLAPAPVFKTGALNRSATHPARSG
jgi:fatty-acyl-CoA synthase